MYEEAEPCNTCPLKCQGAAYAGRTGGKKRAAKGRIPAFLNCRGRDPGETCEHHADLLRKVAGLCNNTNQLAHVANATGRADTASVQEMLRISKEVWKIVKEEW